MAITSSFANLATVTRASKKTDAGGWDFTSGGTVGTLTEYASGVAAIHSTAGLLVEESSTNEIRNPRCEGASGSTPPTYWLVSAAGLTITYKTVTIDGCPGVRIAMSGTASGNLQFISDNVYAPASQGDTFTSSAGLILESGSLPTGFEIGLQHRIAGSLAETDSASITGADSLHRRFFLTGTVATSGVDTTNWYLRSPGLAEAVNCTIVVLAPQLEEKAFATSPVLPEASSPAATTRAADLITLSLGDWFSSTAWTLFFNFTPNVAGKTGKVLGGLGADFNDTAYIDVGATSGTSIALNLRSGGSSSANLTPAGQSNYAVGDNIKVAIAAQVNDFAMSLNGATLATDTAGAMPTANTRLSLGNGPWGATVNNTFLGYIKDLRYFPRRLANAELESLVGN